MKLTLAQIAEALALTVAKNHAKKIIHRISTDTRTIEKGSLFVPLIGENFDGHNFIPQAIASGTSAIFVSDPKLHQKYKSKLPTFLVSDTLIALGIIAKTWRMNFDPKVITITGSCGKTTTKDMITHIASRHFKTHHTKGNFNNRIGVPLTLFELEKKHTHGVFEVGMNIPGELAAITPLVDPQGLVLTNILHVHSGNFPNIDGVRDAKAEMFHHANNAKWAVMNNDCKQSQFIKNIYEKRNLEIITFGKNSSADFYYSNIKPINPCGYSFLLHHKNKFAKVELNIFGHANIFNATCAAATLSQWGLDLETIAEGFSDFQAGKLRSNFLQKNDFTIIADCYNSNPTAVQDALRSLSETNTTGRRVAILGDMLELGDDSEKFHRQVGQSAREHKIDLVIAVGDFAEYIKAEFGSECVSYLNKTDLKKDLAKLTLPNDTILVKGSRGLALEEIVEELTK